MKKIVGTILAASLAFGAFAADPVANFVMSDFSGSAGFGWKADFADSENVKMGMFNDASANLKFGFVKGGDKITTGDGIWGELKIKAGDADATAIPSASVDTAKIHFVDGDFSAALNILKPTIKYGGVTVATATPINAKKPGAEPEKDPYQTLKDDLNIGAEDKPDTLKGKLKAAQNDYDNAVKDGTLTKDLIDKLDAAKAALAKAEATLAQFPDAPAAGAATSLATAGIGDEKGLTAGFGIEVKMDKLFALNFKLMDNKFDAPAKDKKFGMAIDASLLAIDNLNASVASSFNFDTGYVGLQVKGDYKFGLSEKLYVKPVVAYEMTVAGKNDTAKNALTAGVMFGWGAEGCDPNLDFIDDGAKKDDLKTNEGLSIALSPIFGDKTEFLLSIGAYDQSLFSLLGLEDFGTLKTAFAYDAYFAEEYSSNTIALATAYNVEFSPIYANLHAGMQGTVVNSGDTKGEFKPNFRFGVKVGTKEIVDNTDLYVGYELEGTAGAEKLAKSEIAIGTAINF